MYEHELVLALCKILHCVPTKFVFCCCEQLTATLKIMPTIIAPKNLFPRFLPVLVSLGDSGINPNTRAWTIKIPCTSCFLFCTAMQSFYPLVRSKTCERPSAMINHVHRHVVKLLACVIISELFRVGHRCLFDASCFQSMRVKHVESRDTNWIPETWNLTVDQLKILAPLSVIVQ